MDMAEVKRKWESFNPELPDPYRRDGGVRLMLMPSGFGLREDGEGRLHPIGPEDCVVGRDERRVNRIQKMAPAKLTKELEQVMEVPRECVVGKAKTLHVKPVRKALCRISVVDGEAVKPACLFVTYLSPAGNRIRREVLGDAAQ